MGIGDWGLGIGPNPQSPIPNPLLTKKFLINNKYIFKINTAKLFNILTINYLLKKYIVYVND